MTEPTERPAQQQPPFVDGSYPPAAYEGGGTGRPPAAYESGGTAGPPVAYGGGYGPPTAGAGKRFGAYLLNALLSVVTLGIGYVIWTLIVWKDGKTPAWQILGMRAVNADTGQLPTWGHMFVRNFLCYGLMGVIPFWNLVGACFAFDTNNQALWDRMAHTYVING